MAKTELELGIKDKASKALQDVTKNYQKFQKETSLAAVSLNKIAEAALGAVTAFASWKTIEAATRAWAVQEQAVARLNAVLQNVAPSFEVTSGQLQNLASKIQSTTVYGDEAILQMQTRLLAFDQVQGPVFERAQRAAVDLASAYQLDLTAAAEAVGKALQSPTQGLRGLEFMFGRLDPATKKFIEDLIRQGRQGEASAKVLELIEAKVGGAAQSFAEFSDTAKLQQFENKLGDVLERVGKRAQRFQAVLSSMVDPLFDRILEAELIEDIVGQRGGMRHGPGGVSRAGDVGQLVSEVAMLSRELGSAALNSNELAVKIQSLNSIDLDSLKEVAERLSLPDGPFGGDTDRSQMMREFLINLEDAIKVQERFNESRRRAAAAIEEQARAEERLAEIELARQRRIKELVDGRAKIEEDLQRSLRNTERLFRDTRIDELERARLIQRAYEQAMDALSKLDDTYDGIGADQGDILYRRLKDSWDAARESVGDLEYEIKLSEDRARDFEERANRFLGNSANPFPDISAQDDSRTDPWSWVPWNEEYKTAVAKYEEFQKEIGQQLLAIQGTVFDVWETINSIEAQRHQDRIAALRQEAEEVQRSYDIQVAAARAAGQETATIELEKLLALKQQNEKIQEAERKARVDQFNHQKAMSIAQASINGYEAATKAFAQGGPIFGPALALTIGGLTAYQIGMMLAQQPPQFAEGGLLFPRPGGQTFMHGAGAKTFAEAGQPEAILPLNRLQEFVDIPKGSGALVVNLTIAAPVIGMTEEDLYVNIDKGIQKAVYDGRILR